MNEAARIELERDALRLVRTSTALHRSRHIYPDHKEIEKPFNGKYRLDPKGMALFREKIRTGDIPLGPRVDHTQPVKDRRDNTDPTELGLQLLAARHNGRIPQ